jgi:LysM repeat protein
MAIKEVLSNPEKYGYQYIKGTGYQPFQLEKVSVTLSDSISVVDLAEAAGLTYRQFLVYNPFVQSDTLPPGTYYFNVPPEQKNSFVAKVEEIKKRYAQQFRYHVVSKGETLASIAKRYGVSVDDIKRWNQISANHVVQGQTLKIKVSSSR